MKTTKLFCALFLAMGVLVEGYAQEAPSLMNAKGNSPLALYASGDFDNVNPVNGNVFLSIPVVAYPQRGHALSLGFNIYYNSNLWFSKWVGDSAARWDWTDSGGTNVGAYIGRTQYLSTGVDIGSSSSTYADSGRNTYTVTRQENSTWVREASGAKHYIGDRIDGSCNDQGRGSCPTAYSTSQKWFPASDSTGFTPNTGGTNSLVSVADPSGNVHVWPGNYETITDTNGNQIVATQSGWTDTIGRVIPGSIASPSPNDNIDSNSGTSNNPATSEPYPGIPAANVGSTLCPSGTSSARIWSIPGVSGSTQTYYLCFTKQTFQTAFNANTTQAPYYTFIEAKSTDSGFKAATMLTAVVLPDGTSYTFTYDQYLSLTKLTLPTGGSISYSWVNLPYGHPTPYGLVPVPSRSLQSRTMVSGSGAAQTWTYYYTTTGADPSSYTYWSVTTDPNGNDTEYQNGAFATGSKMVYSGCSQHNASPNRTCSGSGSVLSQENYGYTYAGSLGADQDTAGYHASIWMQQRTSTRAQLGGSSSGVTKSTTMTLPPKFGSCSFQSLSTTNPPQPPQTTSSNACFQLLAPSQTTVNDYGSAGSTTAGNVLQVINNTYQWQANASYLSANLLNLVASTTISDGSGTQVASTAYGYDETGSPQGALGNNTSQTRWVNATSSITTSSTFTTQGMVGSTTDGNKNTTTIVYDSSGLFPASITRPATATAHVDQFQYDSSTGAILSHTDENSQTTTYSYQNTCSSGPAFDPFGRVQKVTFPATSAGTPTQTSCYTDSASGWSVTTTDPVQTSVTTAYDGLGRPTFVTNNSSGVVQGAQYDFAGRVSFTSNPDTSLGSVGTSFGYDPLGRMLIQTNADGTTKNWSYQGATTTAVDEAGNAVSRGIDGLGRLVGVGEIESDGGMACVLSGGHVTNCHPLTNVASTQYTYDALGNLTTVNQAGVSGETPRVRSFTYDGLSRLLTATNPETGTDCYGMYGNDGSCVSEYDGNSNVMAKTNNKGLTTIFEYDTLNRLTFRWRLGGSKDLYFYDGAVGQWAGSYFVGPDPHVNGRLSFIRSFNPDLAGSTCNIYGQKMCDDQYFGYDEMGRLKHWMGAPPSEWGAQIHAIDVTYDLAGHKLQTRYPDGRLITQSYDSAGRLSTIMDGTGQAIVNAISYFPNGTTQSISYGNGVTETFGQNSRLQTCSDLVTNGTKTYLNKTYHFQTNASITCGNETGNNGNIYGIVDGTPGSIYTQSMTYDSLNRLSSWSGPNFPTIQSMAFGYDSFGNMTQVPGSQALAANTDFNAKNQFLRGSSALEASFSCVGANGETTGYDAAGNLLCWGTPNSTAVAYTWDGDNRMARLYSSQNSTLNIRALYSYDAMGNRVRADQWDNSSGATSYREYSSFNGETLSEKTQNGWWTDYIFANGKKVARVEPSNVYRWMIADQVGSAQLDFDASGTLLWQGEFLPFGQEMSAPTGTNRYKFTGKERDPESALDYFGARYYFSGLGRFMSPDWADKPEAVPYSDLANPQSLNLYGYVNNNPLSHADPDGHECPTCDNIVNFAAGAFNAWGSDNLAGAGRMTQTTSAGMAGARLGDAAAAVQGVAETIQGAAAVLGGGAEALITSPAAGTGVGVLVPAAGAAAAVVGAAEVVHGVATAGTAVSAMMKSSSDVVTSSGQKADQYGNKLGGSGKPQQHETTSNTREGANNKALNEGAGSVNHSNPKTGQPHVHPTDAAGEKKPNSTHHNYPE